MRAFTVVPPPSCSSLRCTAIVFGGLSLATVACSETSSSQQIEGADANSSVGAADKVPEQSEVSRLARTSTGAEASARTAPIQGLDSLARRPTLRWPLEQVHITSRFGWRSDPVSGVGVRLHRGIDLRGATGDLVLATGQARVLFSGWDPLLGELIILDHGDGLESWYAHLSSRLVYEGIAVQRGSAIGNVGNTGRSAAPHLHLTIKLDGEAIDPLPYFSDANYASRD